MKRALFVLALIGTAHAAPATPPAGWTHDTERSGQMSRDGVRVDAYAPAAGRGSLYITRKELATPAAHRNALASAELNELAQAAKRQGSAETTAFAQQSDPKKVQLEASITWRDPALELTQHARTVIAADAERIVVVTGECVLGLEAPPALTAACTSALATLDAEIPTAQRVPLAIVDGGELPPSEREGSAAPLTGSAAPLPPPAALGRPPATIDVGPRGATPSMSPAARESDRRPVYIGGFIVVMAAVFWWNRRRRDRFDREDAKERGEAPAAEPAGDDDADDLAAAARGDAPKDPP